MKLETPWAAGRLDVLRGTRRLLFGQMYEDPEVERTAFHRSGRVFCIASAGNTALQLSREHEVVACDINPVQLAYAERRANGAPPEAGDAERFMHLMRAFMPVVGWRRRIVRDFLAFSDTVEQLAFWREHLDTRRFRAGFDAFMSHAMLRACYAAKFVSFLPSRFGAVMRKRLERGFALHANASNPYIHALLLGEAIEDPQVIPSRVQFVSGDAAAILESSPSSCYDGFSLSNILDGATPAYRDCLVRAVRHAATRDAIVVLRSFSEPATQTESNRPERDRAMLWGVVDIRSARTLYR